MEITAIDAAHSLSSRKVEILALFASCYGKSLHPGVWDWAYTDNVFGDPYVTVCMDQGKMVAHYAVIPFFLINAHGHHLRSYLSMTTMVAPSHRKHGLFVLLAEATYERIAKAGAHCVLGFPNAMSAPGFARRLQWHLDPIDYVARIDAHQLSRDLALHAHFSDPARFTINLADADCKAWRLSKPGAKYIDLGDCVIKDFGDTYDLIWALSGDSLSRIPTNKPVNLLISADNTAYLAEKQVDYQFGYRPFITTMTNISVRKTMSLSDVF